VDALLRENAGERLRQGDILRSIDFPVYSEVAGDKAILRVVRFPRAVVLSQDCDIEHDYELLVGEESSGSRLVSVLMAPLYEMSDAVSGDHLSKLMIKMPSLPDGKKSQAAKDLRRNNNPRYHCLPLSQAEESQEDLIVDFKHYFSVSSRYLVAVRPRALIASLNELYREDLCQRFAAFLSRIGLPSQIDAQSS
jgi:hypothetical protein